MPEQKKIVINRGNGQTLVVPNTAEIQRILRDIRDGVPMSQQYRIPSSTVEVLKRL